MPSHDWPRLPLKEICASMQTGPGGGRSTDQERTAADGGVPVVLPRDLLGQRIVPGEPASVPAVSQDRARTLPKYLLAEGDILVTRTGSVGRSALVTREQAGWLFHPNLIRLRLPSEGPVLAPYLAACLSAATAQDWIRARAVAAVIPSISMRTLGELPVPVPPVGEQRAIGATLAALDDQIRAYTDLVRATSEFRDTLAVALLDGILTPDGEVPRSS
ncbi:restriction endonuclease subunit S [Streptomyces sp. NPDC093094]|uniref:restriction endonuclease subunit S n=1 Tax=Streptomyces sp. NPDC093094 TaxID=3366026 RepID=UPI0037F22BF8